MRHKRSAIPQQRYDIPYGTPTRKCRGSNCGATIYFVPKARDPMKKLPVNADGTPHWSTCKDQETFQNKTRGDDQTGRRR